MKEDTILNTLEEHKAEALRTESLPSLSGYKERAVENLRFIHGAMGLSTEANELLDLAKKNLFYGKEIDVVNAAEEVGDAMWYLAILFDWLEKEHGITPADILTANIAKLQFKRYKSGMKFSDDEAVARDIPSERELLERYFKTGKEDQTDGE